MMDSDSSVRESFSVVGTRPIRQDGYDKVTGKARFGDDVHFGNMLFGKVLRSPHPHAIIKGIDTSKAEAVPGVHAVVTGQDFPHIEHRMVNQGEAGPVDMRDVSDNCVAKDKVLYDGHAIAAVAAENPHVAEEAVKLIEVDYELLEPLMDVRAAMSPEAAPIHEHYFPGAFIAPTDPHLPNATRLQMGVGDIEKGFEASDHIIEREFSTETIHQGYIESHITTVSWDSNGNITVWTTTQGQFEIRDNLAEVLQVPISKVKVIPMEVGGAFGGKDRIYLDPMAAMLSKKSSRPVKMSMRRDEVLRATGPSPGTFIKIKLGVNNAGELTAADIDLAYEAGAYAGGPVFLAVASVATKYKIPNVRINGYDVIVNKPKTRPYRAPGAAQACFAIEQLVDEFARLLDMDPIAFREKNFVKTGDTLVMGVPLPELDTLGALEAVRQHEHYHTPLKKPNQGRGFGCVIWFNAGMLSSASLSVNNDGTVHLTSASPDMAGARTTLAMQAAEVLCIPVSDISASVADSDSIGFAEPTVGSRTAYATGAAVIELAYELIDEMRGRAALLWDLEEADISYTDGVFAASSHDRSLSFKELSAEMLSTGGPITVQKTMAKPSFIPAVAAHLVDVEVDEETGKVEILRYTAFQDVGKAIHPDYVEGQMQGAVVQGIGMALNEELFYDEGGHLKNGSLLDYRMPTCLDVPLIDTVILESPNPLHPFGVRGCGEISIVPPAAAIANAIYDAVGVRMSSMPMAPHKVSEAIAQRDLVGN